MLIGVRSGPHAGDNGAQYQRYQPDTGAITWTREGSLARRKVRRR